MPRLLILACNFCQKRSPETMCETYLGERSSINLVLGGKLETNVGTLLGVPGSLSTSLDGGVDLLVVRSGEDAQGVGGSETSVVGAGGVAESSGVLGDGSLLHIVSDLTTDEEAIMAEDDISDGAGGAAGLQVSESTDVEVGLLEVEVELLALVASSRVEVGKDLSLQSGCESVVELDLGGQEVGRVP